MSIVNGEQMKTLSFSCSDTSLKNKLQPCISNAQIFKKAMHSFWRLRFFTSTDRTASEFDGLT